MTTTEICEKLRQRAYPPTVATTFNAETIKYTGPISPSETCITTGIDDLLVEAAALIEQQAHRIAELREKNLANCLQVSALQTSNLRYEELLNEAFLCMQAFTDPAGGMPDDTGGFRDLGKCMLAIEHQLIQSKRPSEEWYKRKLEEIGDTEPAVMGALTAEPSPSPPTATESVVVPREPTEAMLDAARDWSQKQYGKPIGNTAASGCYRAMLRAAERKDAK